MSDNDNVTPLFGDQLPAQAMEELQELVSTKRIVAFVAVCVVEGGAVLSVRSGLEPFLVLGGIEVLKRDILKQVE